VKVNLFLDLIRSCSINIYAGKNLVVEGGERRGSNGIVVVDENN